MRIVTLLDTSIATDNLGDEIIMDAVRLELRDCLKHDCFLTVPTHDTIGRRGRKILSSSAFGIVGGTNILSSRLLRGANWKLTPLDLAPMQHKIILMGVGWMDYLPKPSRYARLTYDRILAPDRLQSCRDTYTTDRVTQLDRSAVNTACPTMWRLSPEHCRTIPTQKANAVVTALTFYRPKPEHDRALLELLIRSYDKVYLWPQQPEDLAYARSLGNYDFVAIDPDVQTYSDLLRDEQVDYCGSRLHGGIRALQHGRRSLIVTIDNRAREIGRDTGLPTIERDDLQGMQDWIFGSSPTEIRLPTEAIEKWKGQFT